MARRNPGSNGMLDLDDEESSESEYEETGNTATAARIALQRLLRGNSFQEYITTPSSLGLNGTKMGSVLSGHMSPVQRLRFGSSTVDKIADDENHLLHQSMSRWNKITEDNEKERTFEPTYDQFSGGNDESSPGDFHFLPSSQTKVQHVSKDKIVENAQDDMRDDDLHQQILEVADFAASTGVGQNVKVTAYSQSAPGLAPYVALTTRPFGATTGFLHLVKET